MLDEVLVFSRLGGIHIVEAFAGSLTLTSFSFVQRTLV